MKKEMWNLSLIEVNSLCKNYKIADKEQGLSGMLKHIVAPKYHMKEAVKDINFTVEKGESVAYIGSNGAGKSTTIKMLTGILKPTSGNICINGLDPYKHRIQSTKNIGVVFGQRTQLWWDIPIRESFSMLKEIYEIPNSVYDANIKYFGEILGVSEFMGYPARKLSLGQRMRADIVASLIHNPPVIYLDEPTIGLDVAVKERVCEFLKKINKERGTTILLTSHDLDDIEKVCSRIIVIEHGKKLFDGDAALLKRKYAYNRCIVVKTAYDLPKENKICNELPNITVEKTDSHVYEISFNQDEYSAYNIIQKLSEYLPIVDFSLREPSVEQVVKKIYNGEIEREFEV